MKVTGPAIGQSRSITGILAARLGIGRRRLLLRRRRRWRRGGGCGCCGGGRGGLLRGNGLEVSVERLLLFGDLQIARDDRQRIGEFLGVTVGLGDELVLPLPRRRHCAAVDLELMPALVELVHLGVGALLRRVGEARDAAAGDEVAGRADLAEHGQARRSAASIEHRGPVREQLLQLRDALLEARDALLEHGDALVEAADLGRGVDVGLGRGVGVGARFSTFTRLASISASVGIDAGVAGGVPGAAVVSWAPGFGAGGACAEVQRADDDRQRDHCSARRVLPCHPRSPRPGRVHREHRRCAAQTEPFGDQFVEVVGTGTRRLEGHPANSVSRRVGTVPGADRQPRVGLREPLGIWGAVPLGRPDLRRAASSSTLTTSFRVAALEGRASRARSAWLPTALVWGEPGIEK